MTFEWYPIFNLTEFLSTGLVSKTVTVFLDGRGQSDGGPELGPLDMVSLISSVEVALFTIWVDGKLRERGLSRRDLANASGIPSHNINDWLDHKYLDGLTATNMFLIARVLGYRATLEYQHIEKDDQPP